MKKKLLFFAISIILILTLGTIFIVTDVGDKSETFISKIKEEIRQIRDPMSHNPYDDGQCTQYVFDKVNEDKMMIEKSWSDAEHWANRAKDDGYEVNDTPKEGSLLQTESGPIGHVAYIENINEDGSIDISEMNLNTPHEITNRTIEQENIDKYSYIHPKENPYAAETD